jgi:hypothetical protein
VSCKRDEYGQGKIVGGRQEDNKEKGRNKIEEKKRNVENITI